MKKYLSLLSIPALMTLNSCLQEDILKNGGEEVTAKVSITLPGNAAQSRAVTDAPEAPTKSGMRLYLFVYQGDKIVKTITESSVNFSNTVTKDIRLVTGQPYKIAAWADFGNEYYIVSTAEGTVVLPDHNVTGNDANNDAYYALNDDVVLDANTTINLTLTRPFGLVQITTEDWQQDAVKDANLQPNAYTTTISVPTKLTLLSGEASEEQDVTFAGTITDGGADTQKLSFDYVLAGANEAELADFTMEYTQDDKEICDYTFTNIPVRRNYITNITGNVLTKNGALNVTINQDWTEQINEELVEVESVTEVATVVSNAISSKDNVTVKVAGEVTSENDDVALPAVAAGKTVNLIFDNVDTGATLTVKETEGGSSDVSGNVNVTVPQTQESNVNIELPNAHVTVNGKVNTMTASTSATTLVVGKEATITTLNVAKGNVDIYGTVTNIARAEGNTDAQTIVTLYDATKPSTSDEEIIFKEVTTGQIVNKTTGESYATIADAVLAANANDVIELAEGEYPLNQDVQSTTANQKFYLPIEVEGLTIRGKGDVAKTIIYGEQYTANGAWGTQTTIAVFAENVTLENLTLMPKQETNKLVEVHKNGFKMINCVATANTKVTEADENDAASIYFAGDATNGIVRGCTINKGNICFDSILEGEFTIENNTFNGHNQWGDTKYPNFTCSQWGNTNDLSKSTMVVNIKNNKFEDVTPLSDSHNVPVVRATYGIFNLEGNTFPAEGKYWEAAPSSSIKECFGAVYVNYNSMISQTWVKDRTEPKNFAISNDVIEFETQKAPANTWYAWHGRKAAVNMNPKSSWEVSSTLTVTSDTCSVNKSMWLNIGIDWPIVLFKQENGVRTWRYWDSNGDGQWLDVPADTVPTKAGDYKIKIAFNNGVITEYINDIEIASYEVSEKTSAVKEIIFNSYSIGESYKTTWTYPIVK